MIYSSSPDRGLIYLLNHWPTIRAKCPDAELHVFYGFDVFDAIHRNNPERMQWKADLLQLMKQPGIVYHGRVGHKALEAELAQSGIWAYPTHFDEISCITAMKAQAYGAIPVVTNRAALQETVRNGIKVDVDITEEEGQQEYVTALVDLLNDPTKQESIRGNMMPWAQKYFQWSHVADSWNQLLHIYIQNPEKGLAEKYAERT
jgi:glycosyltransferase involved in cell wall biosynthesis